MKLLIVDDNRYVVEGLKRQIDWNSFGIDELFGCYNVADAKHILTQNQVDFVISDIEMPGQSGFDLLEWIRQRDSELEVVLLTSYTDFTYAQKAVTNKVSQYLLKPLKTEALEKVVQEMVQQHQTREKKKRLIEYGNKWVAQQNNVKEVFWKQMLGELVPANKGHSGTVSREQVQPYAPTDRLTIVLIFVDTGTEVWQEEMLCFLCNNTLGELSANKQSFEAAYCVQAGQFAAVFRAGEDQTQGVEGIISEFVDFTKVYFQFNITYHIFDPCSPDKLKEQLKSIGRVCSDNADRDASRLIEPAQCVSAKPEYQAPDAKAWKRMIQLGSMDLFQESLSEYFQTQKDRGVPLPDLLGLLQVDWNLMVSELIRENTAYQSISQLRSNQFGQWLTQDAQKLEDLMLEEANLLSQEIHNVDDSLTLVAKIKTYIQEHIEDVNRGEIAEQFYLSPSYLSKLFRRETGESLINYIQKERISLAKELLLYSDYSISDIAIQTGYPNFSHFSKQFRKFVGCAPNEFRKNKNVPKQAER